MKSVLVTGGSGLLGRCVVQALMSEYEVTVLDLVPPKQDVAFRKGDVRRLPDMVSAVRAYDAVIHLAAIPHPLNHPANEVVELNVGGTFTMLEACAQSGVKKFILASSESTLGFAFMTRPMYPLYVPVDEEHPLRPQDPYGMSKVLCEEMCRTYTRRYGIQTLSLRMPWIWVPVPKEIQFYKQLTDEYPNWYKNLWAFIHGMDAADAFKRALERPLREEYAHWFITADENWTGIESEKLVKEYFPKSDIRTSELTGTASLISNKKAKKELGFSPLRRTRDIFETAEYD